MGNKIGRITTAGSTTEYPLPNGPGGQCSFRCPQHIATGRDGALWFTEGAVVPDPHVGRITTSGRVTEYQVPVDRPAGLTGITAGGDGAVWFGLGTLGTVGRVSADGHVESFRVPAASAVMDIGEMTSASDASAAAWFVFSTGPNPGSTTNYVARVTASGSVALYRLQSQMLLRGAIAPADDGGEFWVGDFGTIWKVQLG